MEGVGSGKGAGDNGCKDGKDETGVAEIQVVCSDERPNVEG